MTLPEAIYYVDDYKVKVRNLNISTDDACSTLIGIPRIDEDKIMGVAEGHFITTGAQNKFEWMKTQLSILRKPTERGCAQIKKDISRGIRFNYNNWNCSSGYLSVAVRWLEISGKFCLPFYANAKHYRYLNYWKYKFLNFWLR